MRAFFLFYAQRPWQLYNPLFGACALIWDANQKSLKFSQTHPWPVPFPLCDSHATTFGEWLDVGSLCALYLA